MKKAYPSSVYKPREDSTLLERCVKKYAKGAVLDIGTGSGIQALAAAKSRKVKSVLAIDIQSPVIQYNKNNTKNKKITFMVSDLFENINKKFDTVIFNPPYLPNELKVKDLTLEGGKKGYEVLERFLNNVNLFLNAKGIVLIIFSSFTKKEKVDEFIRNNLLEFKELDKKHIFFEDLYIYKIEKSEILKKLEKKGINNINYFAKGKRGFVFKGEFKNKIVGIKIKNPESEAILRTNNEINFLKILNKKNIGPKLLFSDKDYIIYKFIEGNFIIDYLKNNKKENIKKIIRKILEQMFIMDKLKTNKEEMSHPQKHIIINKKNNPVLIDFERAHHTIKPGNVTQVCDFLISSNIKTILQKNNIKINKKEIINAAKKYKKEQNSGNFNKILETIE
jgi:release factor glutamine methyltransferase